MLLSPVLGTPRRRARLAVLSGIGAMALAGCGSSDSLSHADLVSQANAACKNANEQIATLAVPTDQAGLATYAAATAKASKALQSKIASLDPPKDDKAAVDKYIAGLNRSNTLLTQMVTAARKGDAGRVKSLATHISSAGVGVLAARAGLGTCATAPAPAAG